MALSTLSIHKNLILIWFHDLTPELNLTAYKLTTMRAMSSSQVLGVQRGCIKYFSTSLFCSRPLSSLRLCSPATTRRLLITDLDPYKSFVLVVLQLFKIFQLTRLRSERQLGLWFRWEWIHRTIARRHQGFLFVSRPETAKSLGQPRLLRWSFRTTLGDPSGCLPSTDVA